MIESLKLNKPLVIFGAPLALLGIIIFLMTTPAIIGNDSLSLAISVDLLLTIPLCYFLLIRKTAVPNTTVIAMMIIGLLIGSYFLPEEQQTYLNLFKTWLLPVLELSLISYIIVNVRKAINKYQTKSASTPDFFTALKSTCQDILPHKLVPLFATEIAVIYYGFIQWKPRLLQENEFSYHKESGSGVLFGILILLIGIETTAFHLLLASWNLTAAWILTGISLYTAIQIFGLIKSLAQRPIVIDQKHLTLRYGLINEVEIPFAEIASIELSRKPLAEDALTKTLSPLGTLESHNVILHLTTESQLIGLYGMKKAFKVIGLHVDQAKDFKENLDQALDKGL